MPDYDFGSGPEHSPGSRAGEQGSNQLEPTLQPPVVHKILPAKQRGIHPVDHAKYLEKPRLTLVCTTVHHHPDQESPTVVDSRYTRFLESDEQCFIRQTRIGDSWEPLDIAWLKRVSLLIIQNSEGKRAYHNPTEAEKEAVKKRVILLGIRINDPGATGDGEVVPFAKIRPTESLIIEPTNLKLVMCCEYGEARYILTAFPD